MWLTDIVFLVSYLKTKRNKMKWNECALQKWSLCTNTMDIPISLIGNDVHYFKQKTKQIVPFHKWNKEINKDITARKRKRKEGVKKKQKGLT